MTKGCTDINLNRIVFLLSLVLMMWIASTASAESLSVGKDTIVKDAYYVQLQMPCNWDRIIPNIKVYGVYGEQPYSEERIEKVGLHRDKGDLFIKFPQQSVVSSEGLDLFQARIDFGATSRRCANGFGFNMLSK